MTVQKTNILNGPHAVAVSFTEGVATLRLCRPERANAIDHEMARDLRKAVDDIAMLNGVRVVVIEAAGKSFCVGGDLKSFAAQGADAPAYVHDIIENFHAALMLLVNLPAPVITVVQGAAAGAGMGLALAGDIVLAAEDSKFVMAYTNAGVTPDGGTTWILPRLVGLHRALDLTLRNRVLLAAEARDLGLVAEIHPAAQLAAAAKAVAEELARGPTAAFAEAKRLLRQSFHNDLQTQLAAEGETVVGAFATKDGQEGARAFLERRSPTFRGRLT